MSSVREAFVKGKAFIPFITAGDPNLDTTVALAISMAQAGADLIELGIPFSDPVAEGPVIARADMRALSAGTTTDKIFDAVRKIRAATSVPLAFMTYINPVFAYGTEKFMENCAACGIDAVIVPDLPFEEKNEILPLCEKNAVELISLIAPTSGARIQMIASQAQGFVYCVSSLGVTGVRGEITTDIKQMVSLVKKARDIPCAVGFGISTPAQAADMAAYCDGVIVGSAIVSIIERYGENCVAPVTEYVREMKHALSAGHSPAGEKRG